MLRVAFLVSSFPSLKSPNAGIFNFNAAKRLSQLARLTIVHLRAWKPFRAVLQVARFGEVEYVVLAAPVLPSFVLNLEPSSMALYSGVGWLAVRQLLAGCDLVHSVGASFAGVLASRWAGRLGLPHVTQAVGTDVNFDLPRFKNHISYRGWETHVQGVACNSSALADRFRALYPNAPNIRTIYRGVDLEEFSPDGAKEGPLVEAGFLRLVFIGGIADRKDLPARRDYKGALTVMKAWSEIESHPAARQSSLLFAGPECDCARVASWRAALKYPERVFLMGHIPHSRLAANLRAADVLLLPSKAEGLPNAALEASACARAVLGSDVGGVPEAVRDHVTGRLLPPDDIEAWKKAILDCAMRPEETARMGLAARKMVEERFDARWYGDKILALYHDAMATFAASRRAR
jgi:glycosyltransferase involved in cell wall biosynthesis